MVAARLGLTLGSCQAKEGVGEPRIFDRNLAHIRVQVEGAAGVPGVDRSVGVVDGGGHPVLLQHALAEQPARTCSDDGDPSLFA